MSQENETVNFLIHDAQGQPQMVKVIQNKPVIKVKPNPVKLFKLANSTNSSQGLVFRTVKVAGIKGSSKIVQLPVHTLAQLQNIQSTGDTQTLDTSQDESPVQSSSAESSLTPESELDSKELTISPNTKPSNSSHHPSLVMAHASRRRHEPDNEPVTEYTTKRRKHADKVGKGLRHFSMKVCEKVRTKVLTTYNEVADELVAEFAAGMHGSADSQQYDQKNIRRRVYDALNVLMAMNIISKEKKEIRWLGLPTNSIQECIALEKEKQDKLECIQKKTQQLHELILQHISFKSLIERNKCAEAKGVKPSPSSAIHLPFIVVNTSDKALIDCSISNDKKEYMFNFNKRFQIHDDIDILKRMGLLFGLDKGECTDQNIIKAKNMVPKSLEAFVEQMGAMGAGSIPKLADILESNSNDGSDEECAEDVEADDGDPNGYSDDSSDVDV